MTVVWSPRAIGHLSGLREYIARDRPNAAARIGSILLTTIAGLAKFPNVGRPGRIPGTREFVVPGTPYVVPYRVKGDRIEVIAIFHGRQQWPNRL